MNVRKLRHVIEQLLDQDRWKLEHCTEAYLSFRCITPLPGSYPLVTAKATETGFELSADGDVWQDLRQDLEQIYGSATWAMDLKTFVGYANFKCT